MNVNSYTSTITLTPLNNNDASDYTCTGTISHVGSGFDVDVEPYIILTNDTVLYTLALQGIYITTQQVTWKWLTTQSFLISIQITYTVMTRRNIFFYEKEE